MTTIDIRKEDCEKLLNMCSLNYAVGKRRDDRDLMNTSSEMFASLSQSLNSKATMWRRLVQTAPVVLA